MLNIPVSYRKGEEVQHFFFTFAFAAQKGRKEVSLSLGLC